MQMIADATEVLSKLDSTAFAAIIAAFASLITLAFTIVTSFGIDRKVAHRASIQESLNEMGGFLYQIVALSETMRKSKSEQKFADNRYRARLACLKLDEISRRLRYALWGIDEGFRTMRMIPSYIANLKDVRFDEDAVKVIAMATSLRCILDKAVMNSYLNGTSPGWYMQIRVWWSYYRLRRYFKSLKPHYKEGELDE